MRELYWSVSYYGIGKIIRRYSNFCDKLPLPVSIQHGWCPIASKHDALRGAPENWYWSKDIEKLHKVSYPGIKTRSVGSPFMYLLRCLEYEKASESSRQGSIVFPSHSSQYIRTSYDYKLYADMLDGLPDCYKPITICIYYLDKDNDQLKPFVDKGFEIINNGNSLYDPDFLYNFVENVKNKLYAFSNEPTTALLYASAMGVTAYNYGPKKKTVLTHDASEHDRDIFYKLQKTSNDWKKYFSFPDCDLRSQQEYCKTVLGTDNLLNKTEMNKLLNGLVINWRYFYSYMRRFNPFRVYL